MTQSSANLDISPQEINLDYDAIVIGAGVAGIYQLYKLRNLGMSVRVFEAGTGAVSYTHLTLPTTPYV